MKIKSHSSSLTFLHMVLKILSGSRNVCQSLSPAGELISSNCTVIKVKKEHVFKGSATIKEPEEHGIMCEMECY